MSPEGENLDKKLEDKSLENLTLKVTKKDKKVFVFPNMNRFHKNSKIQNLESEKESSVAGEGTEEEVLSPVQQEPISAQETSPIEVLVEEKLKVKAHVQLKASPRQVVESFRNSLKKLNEVHVRMKFLLGEIKDLVKK